MVALVLRIVFRSLVTLFLLTACVFFALHLTGDPARIMLGDGADATALAAFQVPNGVLINRCGNNFLFIYRNSSLLTWEQVT